MEYHTDPVNARIKDLTFPFVILERCLNEVRKWRLEPEWMYVHGKYEVLFTKNIVNILGTPISFTLHMPNYIRLQWQLLPCERSAWMGGHPAGAYIDIQLTEEELELLDSLLSAYYEKEREEDFVNEEYQ